MSFFQLLQPTKMARTPRRKSLRRKSPQQQRRRRSTRRRLSQKRGGAHPFMASTVKPTGTKYKSSLGQRLATSIGRVIRPRK